MGQMRYRLPDFLDDEFDDAVLPNDTPSPTADKMVSRPSNTGGGLATVAGMAQLQHCLDLHPRSTEGLDPKAPRSVQDVLFLAIYFEGSKSSKEGIDQIGVSVLDTRSLRCASDERQDLVTTRLYGVSKPNKSRLWDRKPLKSGIVYCVNRNQFVSTLEETFQEISSLSHLSSPTSSENDAAAVMNPAHRKVVLVGHGLENECNEMELLGFHPELHANIIGLLDTRDLAFEVYDGKDFFKPDLLASRLGLRDKDLLRAGARPVNGHSDNAGTHSSCTMDAFLYLAVEQYADAADFTYAGWIGLTRLCAGDLVKLFFADSPNTSQKRTQNVSAKWSNSQSSLAQSFSSQSRRIRSTSSRVIWILLQPSCLGPPDGRYSRREMPGGSSRWL